MASVVLVLVGCSGGGGPSKSDVTEYVKRDEARRNFTVTAVKGIRCSAERGNAGLFTCRFKITYDRGRDRSSSGCFRDIGRGSWDYSGNGRNCLVFRR